MRVLIKFTATIALYSSKIYPFTGAFTRGAIDRATLAPLIQWKLFDVTIAGISMVATVRTALLAEIKKSGLDGLIQTLQQKSKAVDA